MKTYEIDGVTVVVNGTLNIQRAGEALNEIINDIIKRKHEKSKSGMMHSDANEPK
ncbi:MAG: hypothetical protein K0S71_3059 [Clostridia bacterium]|jgi:hypothetical protein|nr:hypothetical protein [Clostridia bacterium]